MFTATEIASLAADQALAMTEAVEIHRKPSGRGSQGGALAYVKLTDSVARFSFASGARFPRERLISEGVAGEISAVAYMPLAADVTRQDRIKHPAIGRWFEVQGVAPVTATSTSKVVYLIDQG